MNRTFFRLVPGLAIAALAISLGGCGKPTHDVTGHVKYNGAPLDKPDGKIVFVGPDGTQVVAPIGQDGAYTATKVTGGLNRIAVYYPNPAFVKPSRPKGGMAPKNPPPSSPLNLTPESYASPETSELSVEVAKGTVFDVDMKGPTIP